MHVQHQKGIPLTIPKDPVDDHKIYTVRKKNTLLFPSLPTATAKKPTLTFCHCRPPWFAFCHCKPTQYARNVQLDTSMYRKIQIRDTSKI